MKNDEDIIGLLFFYWHTRMYTHTYTYMEFIVFVYFPVVVSYLVC